MSDLLRPLYASHAFKPSPSLWELAAAHVPSAELGLEPEPESRVKSGLVAGDGLTFLVGESGSGKSSVLAHVAWEMAALSTVTVPPRRYLPIFVPVAGRDDVATDLEAFGRASAVEVLLALRGGLPAEYQDQLEQLIATEVTAQRTGPSFNGTLAGRVFGTGAEFGINLAGDVVSITGKSGLDNRGGLRTLGEVMRTRGYELIVLVEDTDGWATAPDGESTARDFFSSVVRPLANEIGIGVAVAVQSRWDELPEFAELRERAVSVIGMPVAASPADATPMIAGVLSRRMERALGAAHPTSDAFTAPAIELLAHWTHECRGFRFPLARVRDAFDRYADALPEKIDREHLLETG